MPQRTAPPTADGAVYVLVRSWNRPLYLWACLDSLYRHTRHPCRVVLLDNASTDPAVRDVVAGFERRGLFHAVHFMERNDGANQQTIFERYRAAMGRYVVLVDADITVEPSSPDWLGHLIAVADRDPGLGILGSVVDTADFVDLDEGRRIAPELSPEQIAELIKARSPERRLATMDGLGRTDEVIEPFIPPGRLLLVRTDLVDRIGLPIGNRRLCDAARADGQRVGIAAQVRHRHLSLLNVFDYPEYDFGQLRRYLASR